MIVLGSSWTSDAIDLQQDDDSEYPITGYTLQADFYERIGAGQVTTDDYGSVSGDVQPTPLLSVTTTDGGVVISSGASGIFYITLTKAQTVELRRKLGAPFWKSRRLAIQVRRTDNSRSDHILFIIERTTPGAGA